MVCFMVTVLSLCPMEKDFMGVSQQERLKEQGILIINKFFSTFYRHNGEIIPGQWKNNIYIDKNIGRK